MDRDNDNKATNEALILQEIKKRLDDNPHLDESGIVVEVRDSRVILRGKIDTDEEKALAEKIAGSVPGVSQVENHLHLSFGLANTLAKIVSSISEIDIEKDKKKDSE